MKISNANASIKNTLLLDFLNDLMISICNKNIKKNGLLYSSLRFHPAISNTYKALWIYNYCN